MEANGGVGHDLNTDLYICSKHFEADCFSSSGENKRRILFGCVPSLPSLARNVSEPNTTREDATPEYPTTDLYNDGQTEALQAKCEELEEKLKHANETIAKISEQLKIKESELLSVQKSYAFAIDEVRKLKQKSQRHVETISLKKKRLREVEDELGTLKTWQTKRLKLEEEMTISNPIVSQIIDKLHQHRKNAEIPPALRDFASASLLIPTSL